MEIGAEKKGWKKRVDTTSGKNEWKKRVERLRTSRKKCGTMKCMETSGRNGVELVQEKKMSVTCLMK